MTILAGATTKNRSYVRSWFMQTLIMRDGKYTASFALGCFLEGTTILLIVVPVLIPTAQARGIDPVYLGVVAVMSIMIGLLIGALALITFVPDLVLALPRLLGYKG